MAFLEAESDAQIAPSNSIVGFSPYRRGDPAQGTPLNLRLDLRRHSPSGFEWGYAGSGPAQLALAMLADYLQNDGEALVLHQQFKVEVTTKLPHASWALAERDMDMALATIQHAARQA